MATNPETRAIVKAPVTAGNQLAAFVPQSLDEAWRLAGALASSGMTPKAYGSDQNKVMVGIMAGAELGLTPFAALQSIAVIGNNPAVWGDGLLALVEASGKLGDIEESDDGNTATCRVVRVGRPTAIVRTFSMEDAKKAGLAGKSGPWSQYPGRMRQMRARAFALRDGFADVLRGMKSAEEVRDYVGMGGAAQIAPSNGRLSAAALIEAANDTPHDAETGEAETGRSDEQHGDQHDDAHPGTAIADDLVARYARATVIADSLGADHDFTIHGDAMLDEDRSRVVSAKAASDKRMGR